MLGTILGNPLLVHDMAENLGGRLEVRSRVSSLGQCPCSGVLQRSAYCLTRPKCNKEFLVSSFLFPNAGLSVRLVLSELATCIGFPYFFCCLSLPVYRSIFLVSCLSFSALSSMRVCMGSYLYVRRCAGGCTCGCLGGQCRV